MYKVWDDDRELNGYERCLLQLSCLPEFQWVEDKLKPDDCDIEAYDRLNHIREEIDKFVHSAGNLLIMGENLGCGKTSWAVKLLLSYIEAHENDIAGIDAELADSGYYIPGMFIQTIPFLVEMKQFGNNQNALERYNRICKADLVVFDDVAAVNMTQYDYTILYALIERRVFAGQSCIYTSNATSLKDLEKELGPRLADRIWKNSLKIELKGRGFRH